MTTPDLTDVSAHLHRASEAARAALASLPREAAPVPQETEVTVDRCHGALLGVALGEALGLPVRGLASDHIAHTHGELTGFVADARGGATEVGRVGAVTRTVVAGARQVVRTMQQDAAESSAEAETPPEPTGPSDEGLWLVGLVCGFTLPCEPLEPVARAGATVGAGAADIRGEGGRTLDAAAAAVLAVLVSSGVHGMVAQAVVSMAMAAADAGGRVGQHASGPDLSARIRWATALASGSEPERVPDLVELLVGTSHVPQEAIPAALILTEQHTHPWEGCLAAASLGGDAHVLAATVGAIVGARAGASGFPADAVAHVERINPGLNLRALAEQLAAARPALRPATAST